MTSFRDSLRSLLFSSNNKSANRYGDRYRDSIDLNKYLNFGTGYNEKISKYDFLHKNEEELLAIYKKDAGIIERLVFKQKAKHIKDESKLIAALIGHTTWAALLMMPCLALVLFLLYIRHHYYFIEHLIFTFHLHAFSFLVIAMLIAGMAIFPWWIFILGMLTIWLYVFASMKKVYQQSIGKTLFKFLILSISYGGLFFLFLTGTIVFTFFLQ
jgi:hypothetical protein